MLLQVAWAREYAPASLAPSGIENLFRAALWRARRFAARTPLRRLRRLFTPLLRLARSDPASLSILSAQIRHYRPDVLVNQYVAGLTRGFLQNHRPWIRFIVGQIASPLTPGEDYRAYDLMISSLPNLVEGFRRGGVRSELHRLAFEPSVLTRLGPPRNGAAVTFVGTLSSYHRARIELLERLCRALPLEIWGTGIESLPRHSPFRSAFRGAAWGAEMFRILRDSKVTVNHHIDMASEFANNMRLYEATGVGTLLVTDEKRNLPEMFEPGKEVATYRNPEECVERIRHYLDRESERAAVAAAGQRRTLREHTYENRMRELLEILRRIDPGLG